jgi:hypothetical protein
MNALNPVALLVALGKLMADLVTAFQGQVDLGNLLKTIWSDVQAVLNAFSGSGHPHAKLGAGVVSNLAMSDYDVAAVEVKKQLSAAQIAYFETLGFTFTGKWLVWLLNNGVAIYNVIAPLFNLPPLPIPPIPVPTT